MVRKALERSNIHYYHLLGRSNDPEFFDLPQSEVWNIFTRELGCLQQLFQLKIAAFVLLNNHFHLIALTPKESVDRVMYFLMKNVATTIKKRSGRINKVFGGRYKGSIIKSDLYLLNIYKYIHLEPVNAKLATMAELYRFSTLFYRGDKKHHLPFCSSSLPPMKMIENLEGLNELDWINMAFSEEESNSIKVGLKKSTFAFGKSRNT